MSLIAPGYLPSSILPDNYFHDDYFPDYGESVNAAWVEILDFNSPITTEVGFDSQITKTLNFNSPLGD